MPGWKIQTLLVKNEECKKAGLSTSSCIPGISISSHNSKNARRGGRRIPSIQCRIHEWLFNIWFPLCLFHTWTAAWFAGCYSSSALKTEEWLFAKFSLGNITLDLQIFLNKAEYISKMTPETKHNLPFNTVISPCACGKCKPWWVSPLPKFRKVLTE